MPLLIVTFTCEHEASLQVELVSFVPRPIATEVFTGSGSDLPQRSAEVATAPVESTVRAVKHLVSL